MFVNYNDYELLYLINDEGSEQAFKILYSKYEIYIRLIINKYMFKSDKRDDMYQEALLILNKCISNFNECFNISFFSYFSIALKRKFIQLKRDKYYHQSIFLEDYNIPPSGEAKGIVSYSERIVKAKTNEMGILYFEDCIKDGLSLKSFAYNNNLSYYEAQKIRNKVIKEIKKNIE